MVRCDVVMANDISGPMAFRAMEKMGATEVFDPAKVVVVPDHFMPAKDKRSAELQKLLREWAPTQGVTYYEQGRGGIEHTVLVEEGWVVPGSVIAGGDSHTLHLRRARRVRHGPRLDRHRRLPRLREVLAGRARNDPGRVHRREGPLRHREGPDPRGDRRDRRRAAGRTWRSSSSATGAEALVDRRAPGRREHGRRGRLRDGPLPRRRDGRRSTSRAAPTRPWPAGADRPRRRVRADACAIDLDALDAARRAAALARATSSPLDRGGRAARSTRSTSATARTGR